MFWKLPKEEKKSATSVTVPTSVVASAKSTPAVGKKQGKGKGKGKGKTDQSSQSVLTNGAMGDKGMTNRISDMLGLKKLPATTTTTTTKALITAAIVTRGQKKKEKGGNYEEVEEKIVLTDS